MANCVLCGAELVDGKCPNSENHFKKMCLNCVYMNNGMCTNSDNMEAAKAKLIASMSIPSGYELGELTLKPVALKDATRKCSRHEVCEKVVIEAIQQLF